MPARLTGRITRRADQTLGPEDPGCLSDSLGRNETATGQRSDRGLCGRGETAALLGTQPARQAIMGRLVGALSHRTALRYQHPNAHVRDESAPAVGRRDRDDGWRCSNAWQHRGNIRPVQPVQRVQKTAQLRSLDAGKRIDAGRPRLRALWTEWSVEVRVLSGAL